MLLPGCLTAAAALGVVAAVGEKKSTKPRCVGVCLFVPKSFVWLLLLFQGLKAPAICVPKLLPLAPQQ